ncbi:MAG TPA: class II aldolase/adducin family protein [Bacteroidales bacterium]|jgi:L-fuculose-phosphate aldolase|nr:class II aldolase/adducin family protein [Bacteroidales bacterium]HNV95647.1 class II aldolase/adducin family protein [Bacteroidales bacterium]HOU97614.1 class II aldolase/adducin family protein [Bacteroidales bacterium]
MNHLYYAQEVAMFMQRLYRQKLTTSLGGNISLKADNTIFITPSQMDKDRLTADDIIEMDLTGNVIKASNPISMESKMHLSVYTVRSDVKAVIHAHAFWASLFALSDLEPLTDISDEAYYTIKRLAECKYQTMGTSDLAAEVAEKIKNADVLILQNHGVLTCGNTLVEALERLEVINNMAHYAYLANPSIHLKSISPEAKKRIDSMNGK